MEVKRGEVVVIRRSGLHSFNLVSVRSDVYTNHILQCILLIVNQLINYGQSLVLNHAAHSGLITQVVLLSKEVISRFQRGGDRMMRIEWVKSLLIATLSSLCRPEGKIGLYRRFFAQIANLCVRLLRLEIRGSEYFPQTGRDAIISRLFATLRTQGLVGSVFLPTPGIGSYSLQVSREIKNVPSRDQTTPAKNSSEASTLKRKSDGDENKCPICFDFMKDEKDEKGTTRFPNCSHRFHFECILGWMKKKQNCPLCRSGISLEKRQRL
ncbi:hypothetical protein MKX03_002565 [Papaver bracteatum]|nr:hypothetical protein MKX03_002565 [Papaver bracteatum]